MVGRWGTGRGEGGGQKKGHNVGVVRRSQGCGKGGSGRGNLLGKWGRKKSTRSKGTVGGVVVQGSSSSLNPESIATHNPPQLCLFAFLLKLYSVHISYSYLEF